MIMDQSSSADTLKGLKLLEVGFSDDLSPFLPQEIWSTIKWLEYPN